jgi:hypothetical protein
MQRLYRIPLLFLFLAAAIGLFLRWQFVSPTPGIRYTYFLHAHSHVMFLGWVTNALFLAFVEYHLPGLKRHWYRRLFWALQVLVLGMLISFPIQGYGLYSIIFSTLHTLLMMAFAIHFFKETRTDNRTSVWFARISLFFFFISTAGPFALGYLMANNLGQSVWYNFSIYYYLHFQYNGFFIFGILSIFFLMLETKGIEFSGLRVLRFGRWMAIACIPAYALSVLFAEPGTVFNAIGFIAAVIQIGAFAFLLKEVKSIRTDLSDRIDPTAYKLFILVTISVGLKLVLQLASAHAYIAALAYSMRPVIIAYLHLVLVGVISLFILAWYVDRQFIKREWAYRGLALLLIGFVGSEVCLLLQPSSTLLRWTFGFSILMFLATFMYILSPLPPDKNQSQV